MEYTVKTTRTTVETLYTTFPAQSKEDAIKHFKASTSATGEMRYRIKDKVVTVDRENFEIVDEIEALSKNELEYKAKEDKLQSMVNICYDENEELLQTATSDIYERSLIKLVRDKFNVDLEYCENYGHWYKDEMLLEEGKYYHPDFIEECTSCGKKISNLQSDFQEGRCWDCS